MPIRNLQPRLQENIRIRMGSRAQPDKDGRRRPVASETFILTSAVEPLIVRAAEIYGGAPEIWDEPSATSRRQFRLETERAWLDCRLPPAPNIWSQWMERWSAAGCTRRCDGEIDQLSGHPCDCPPDWQTRRKLAATGGACKETTRLQVVLHELGELTAARLETHSYHAAVELLAMTPFYCALAYQRGVFVDGRLTIAERSGQIVPGKPTARFKVISFTPTGEQALALATAPAAALAPGAQPALPPGQPDANQEAWPPRDPSVPTNPAVGLAQFAEEHNIRQSDLLRIANEMCREAGQAPPTTLAALAEHPVLEAVIATVTEAEEPF